MAGRTGGSPGLGFLAHLPEMVTISDREGRIVYANPETEETRDGLAAALRDLLETHVPPRVEAELSVEGDE